MFDTSIDIYVIHKYKISCLLLAGTPKEKIAIVQGQFPQELSWVIILWPFVGLWMWLNVQVESILSQSWGKDVAKSVNGHRAYPITSIST